MSWEKWLLPDPLHLFSLPKQKQMQPDSFEQPATADEGGYIPILFGTRNLKRQNWGYFGDVKQVAIKSKSGKK